VKYLDATVVSFNFFNGTAGNRQITVAAGLTVGTVENAYSDTIAAGMVCSQSTAAEAMLDVGAVVNIYVSMGPNPNPSPTPIPSPTESPTPTVTPEPGTEGETGDVPVVNPGEGTGDEPAVNPEAGTGDEPVVNPEEGTGDEPAVNPGEGTEDEPVVNPEEGTGDEDTALTSIYNIFPITREILKNKGRQAESFTKVAIIVLNQIIRPFTAKWHKKKIEGAFANPTECENFRNELQILQNELICYSRLLADMAMVEDLTELSE